jgi:hypothetical protein
VYAGSYIAIIGISAANTGTVWGNANLAAQNPTQFPAAGLVTQVAVYLDPASPSLTTSGQVFAYRVALNKQGATASLNRDYCINIGW